MPPRLKKLIGLFILLPFLGAYLFAAAALGERIPGVWPAQLAYFIVAGVAWAFPASILFVWAHREPKR
jgi:hypothetical protein